MAGDVVLLEGGDVVLGQLDVEGGDRIGEALNSAVSPGVVVSGAHVYASVLSPLVKVHSYASLQGSVLLDNVEVHRHAQIRRAIIDKEVKVPAGFSIGWDREADLARGLTITDDGVTVVSKAEDLERFTLRGD